MFVAVLPQQNFLIFIIQFPKFPGSDFTADTIIITFIGDASSANECKKIAVMN